MFQERQGKCCQPLTARSLRPGCAGKQAQTGWGMGAAPRLSMMVMTSPRMLFSVVR